MHLFDAERRFMGGNGIVGGNLPIAAGIALSSDYRDTDEVTVCTFGDGAANQGTFGETMNLAALWRLPVVFFVINNQFGMGTALERHSAVTDLEIRGAGYGVPGVSCDGMDVMDTNHAVTFEALRLAREQRQPHSIVEAVTYRFRGHSMADPEQYRTKEQVSEWRKRDPIALFARSTCGGQARCNVEQIEADPFDREAVDEPIDQAVAFAVYASPHPAPESLYDNIYVLGNQVRGVGMLVRRALGRRTQRRAGARAGRSATEGIPKNVFGNSACAAGGCRGVAAKYGRVPVNAAHYPGPEDAGQPRIRRHQTCAGVSKHVLMPVLQIRGLTGRTTPRWL